MGPLIQNLLRIWKMQQHNTKLSVDPSESSALWDYTGCTSLQAAEVPVGEFGGGEISSVETLLHIYLKEMKT